MLAMTVVRRVVSNSARLNLMVHGDSDADGDVGRNGRYGQNSMQGQKTKVLKENETAPRPRSDYIQGRNDGPN